MSMDTDQRRIVRFRVLASRWCTRVKVSQLDIVIDLSNFKAKFHGDPDIVVQEVGLEAPGHRLQKRDRERSRIAVMRININIACEIPLVIRIDIIRQDQSKHISTRNRE